MPGIIFRLYPLSFLRLIGTLPLILPSCRSPLLLELKRCPFAKRFSFPPLASRTFMLDPLAFSFFFGPVLLLDAQEGFSYILFLIPPRMIRFWPFCFAHLRQAFFPCSPWAFFFVERRGRIDFPPKDVKPFSLVPVPPKSMRVRPSFPFLLIVPGLH